MRTTLALDNDVFSFARAHAQRERVSMGEAMSRLPRQGIQAASAAQAATSAPRRRFALLPARAEIITPDHVRKLLDQERL